MTLDPQTDYSGEAWALLRCCLVRTLLSYPGRPTANGGAELRPDLARSFPDVSTDGLTWTFRLKRGLRYGPPFTDREIVAADLVRGLERTARVGQKSYAFYYTVIEGFPEVMAGDADSITGLETPDDHTLVIHLSEPTGELGHRLALPAASPIPATPSGPFGAAEGHEEYGRFLVASGAYMIEGSEKLDFSVVPEKQPPVSGFEPGTSITLVRNPSWRRVHDALRSAYVDRIEFRFLDSKKEAAQEVAGGEADVIISGGAPPQIPTEILEHYRLEPSLSKRVVIAPRDLIVYATMNLAVPPFDDIHVRKAVNYAVDKAGFLAVHAGDQSVGEVTGHAILDSLLNNLLLNYDPYATPGSAGDPDRAKEEMALSRYDHDGDGICDDPACRNVSALAVELQGLSGRDEGRAVASDLEGLGISLDVTVLKPDPYFAALRDPRRHVALGINAGWLKDFPSAGSFVTPLFSRQGLGLDACCNYSLIGATSEELEGWGYEVTSVPTVEEKVSECHPLIGEEQVRCWAELDQQIMEQVVPWVPLLVENHTYIVSRRVVATSFDQFATLPALDQTAVSANSR
jgi:peptide/nickel transport system substrate-binding protein